MEDLDSILDSALDDFEDQELREKTAATASISNVSEYSQGDGNGSLPDDENIIALENMRKLLAEMEDPTYGETLQNTLRNLSSTSEGNENVENLIEEISKQFKTGELPNIIPNGLDQNSVEGADRQVAATLQMLGSSQQGMIGMEASRIEEAGENMMQDMMAQFEALGEKEDYHEVIDGVMRQLLSRDLMYDPIKQVCDKFPEWLALHKDNLVEAEYTTYGKQYQVFQKLLAVYDTEPENLPRLMELMFELQEYGQPPAEIIKGLAPGLQFDENGMPIMPNMGVGMMPGGEGGLPNLADIAGNMGDGKCTIM
eukprot:gene3965-4978_t